MTGRDTDPPRARASGRDEHRLAIGALAQQGTHVVATLVMLVAVTAAGRTLELEAFGVYGLLVSFTAYLLIVQLSVEGAAVKSLGEAQDEAARDRAFSIAVGLYGAAGVLGGVVVVAVGIPAVEVLNVPDDLKGDARAGVVALGVVMAVGWPLKTLHDLLRGLQLFVAAAVAEASAYVLFGVLFGLVLAADGPLWLLIAVGGSPPALIGLCALVVYVVRPGMPRFRPSAFERGAVREFLGLSGSLFALGLSDLVVYSLDRVMLGVFTSARTIGLYEAPVRAHNLLRQLNGTLVLTVLPTASAYVGAGDVQRARDLLVRGTRYVVAAVVPATVVLMVLSEPILEVWLGERFASADTALTLFASYWLAASSAAVAGTMLIAGGRAGALVRLAWAAAAANLTISLALTPWLGLEGVVLGTAIPNLVVAPLVLRLATERFQVSLGALWREVWRPAFSLAIPLAGALVALRLTLDLGSTAPLLAVALGAPALYLAAYAVLWLSPGERLLVRDVLRTLTGRRGAA